MAEKTVKGIHRTERKAMRRAIGDGVTAIVFLDVDTGGVLTLAPRVRRADSRGKAMRIAGLLRAPHAPGTARVLAAFCGVSTRTARRAMTYARRAAEVAS